jgi:hypothetical protein
MTHPIDRMISDLKKFTNDFQERNAHMQTNNAETTIEKPFKEAEDAPLVLTADNIISRTEKDGETVAYEVVNDGKLLFSTVSRPLAQSFLIGWNAGQGKSASKSAATDKDADKPNNEKPATVDPTDISASSKNNGDEPAQTSEDTTANDGKASAQSRKRMLL